ncbi:phage tail tape measure protein [Chengkuizengella marina]|uniref:Phage tail tape measure protein n=1 Tax=Chengkuizengella marina TaxID=2507566 RepID=A0A6N9Q0E9_9BACL|nr:phage tail tape measure protein [Chengkuizengella marina]NBI28592.1 phage tail tape measure protein [Chengkuizengella marina]
MVDNIRILIEAALKEKSMETIEKKLKSLRTKFDKLDIKVNLNGISGEQLKQLASIADKFNQVKKEQTRIIKEHEQVVKKENGTIEKQKEITLSNGEIITKSKELIDEKTKIVEGHTNAVKRDNKALEEQGKLIQQTQKLDVENNKLSSTETRENDNVKSTTTFNNYDEVVGTKIVDNLKARENETKKLTQAKRELRKELITLKNNGRVSRDELLKLNRSISMKDSNAELDKTREKIKELQEISKRGILIDQNNQLKSSNITEEEIENTLKLNQAYKDREIREISLNRVTGQWTASLKENDKQNRIIKGAVDKTTGSLYKNSEALREVTARNLGFGEQFKIAAARIPIWMGAMTAFYFPIRSFQQGIQYIYEIDKAMTNLRKVTDETEETYRNFEATSNKVAQSLGAMTVDVINSGTEWARLGYNIQQAQKLTEETIIYANVGDMEVEDANKALLSAIKGFGIEVDEQGKNVRKIIDLYNQVGNEFSTSSAGLGEGLRRSASSLKEAGNTIEESVALIVAANTTIQDPASVGTALKTVSMRIRGIGEEGEDLSRLVPTLESSFKNLGLTLKQDENTFKSTYDIFNDLATVWEDLSDFEQANITELVAGKRQGNIIASLLANWQDATDSLEVGLNSAGSAAKEYENYLNSMEAKVKEFQNATVGFWQNFIDTEAVKNFVEFGTSTVLLMTKLTDTFGSVGSVAGVTTTALIAFNSTIRASTIGAFATQIEKTTWHMNLYKNSAIAARFATIALQGTMTLGLTVAVAGLVGVISEFTGNVAEAKREQEEFVRSTKDAYQSFEQNYNKLKDLTEQYEILSEKLSLSLEEQAELKRVREEINEILPKSIKYYDDEGEAVYATSEEVRELTEEYRKLNLERAKIIYGDSLSNIDGVTDTLSENLENQKKAIEEYNKAVIKEEGLTLFKDLFSKSNLSELEQGSQEYMNELNNLLDDLKTGVEGLVYEKGLDTDLAKELESDIRFDLFGKKKDIKDYSNYITENLQQAEIAIDIFDGKVNETGQKVRESLDTLKKPFYEFTDTLDIEDGTVQKFIESFAESFVEVNEKAIQEDFNGMHSLFKNEIEKILQLQEGEQIDLSKIYSSSGLKNIKDELSVLERSTKVLSKTFEEFETQVEETDESLSDLPLTLAEVQENVSQVKEEMSLLRQAEEEINDEGKLTQDTLDGLVAKYDDFINVLGLTNDEILNFISAKKEEKIEFINAEIEKTNTTIEESNIRLQILQAEYAIYEQQYAKMEEMSNKGLISSTAVGAMFSDMVDKSDQIDVIERQKGHLEYLLQTRDNLLNGSTGTSSKSSSSSSSDPLEEAYKEELSYIKYLTDKHNWSTEEQIKALDKLQKSHQEYLSKNKEAYQSLDLELTHLNENLMNEKLRHSKDWIEQEKYYNRLSLEQELAAYERVLETHKENAEVRKEIEREIFRVKNELIDKEIELEEEKQRQLEEGAQERQEQLDQWQIDLESAVRDAVEAMKDYYRERQEYEVEAIEEEIDAFKDAHDEKMDLLDDELSKYEDIINKQLDAIEDQESEDDFNKKLAKSEGEAQEIRGKINELSLDDSTETKASILELEEELADKLEEIEEMKHDREVDLRKENLQHNLDTKKKEIDAERDAAQEKYEIELDELNRKKEAEQQYWQDKIDDQRYYNELIEKANKGHVNNLLSELDRMSDSVKDDMKKLGDVIEGNLIDKLDEAADKLKEVNGDKPTSSKNRKSAEEKAYEDYIDNKVEWYNIYKRYGTSDSDRQQELHEENNEYREEYGFKDYSIDDLRDMGYIASLDTGGYTGSFKGGKLAVLHEKEYVLNPDNFENIKKTAEIANSLIRQAPIPKFPTGTINNKSVDNTKTLSIGKMIHVERMDNNTDIKKIAKDLNKELAAIGFTLK